MASGNQISNNYQKSDLPKADIPCLLCKSCSHSTHQCSLTKSIKDKKNSGTFKFLPNSLWEII